MKRLGAAVVLLIFVSAVWDLIKGFIQYYDFKVLRREDKLYISFAQDYAIKLELTAGQTGCSIAGKTVTAQLTQANTLALEVGDVTVQLRYLLAAF